MQVQRPGTLRYLVPAGQPLPAHAPRKPIDWTAVGRALDKGLVEGREDRAEFRLDADTLEVRKCTQDPWAYSILPNLDASALIADDHARRFGSQTFFVPERPSLGRAIREKVATVPDALAAFAARTGGTSQHTVSVVVDGSGGRVRAISYDSESALPHFAEFIGAGIDELYVSGGARQVSSHGCDTEALVIGNDVQKRARATGRSPVDELKNVRATNVPGLFIADMPDALHKATQSHSYLSDHAVDGRTILSAAKGKTLAAHHARFDEVVEQAVHYETWNPATESWQRAPQLGTDVRSTHANVYAQWKSFDIAMKADALHERAQRERGPNGPEQIYFERVLFFDD